MILIGIFLNFFNKKTVFSSFYFTKLNNMHYNRNLLKNIKTNQKIFSKKIIYVILKHSGALAQLVAHDTGSVGVRGSNPLRSRFYNKSRKGSFLVYRLEFPFQQLFDFKTNSIVWNYLFPFVQILKN